jgi:GTP-binding protein
VDETDSADRFLVYGRGVLHIAVVIETMRREGYEFQVGQPQVVIKEINGQKCEPIEHLVVDVPAESAGSIINLVTQRKGEMMVMEPKGDLQHLEFFIPSRGLIGLWTEAMTATAGEAIIAHRFHEFQPYKGPIGGRTNGVLISQGTGPAIAYAMWKLEDRGRFYIPAGIDVYGGMIVGLHNRPDDLVVNLQKAKQLTNIRTTSADEAIVMAPPVIFSLEQNLEFIEEDEYLEVTPQSLRLRKIYLDENDRKRYKKQVALA